ncbi:hypothetical protein MHZ93_03965 [Roseomonas sp. ACRSG]|nr:hypothetical protein [Roseomonas sp. ACRSG]
MEAVSISPDAVTIATVTSCTNTSGLSLLVAAALLASPPLAVAYAIAGRAAPGIGQDLLAATREVILIQAGGMPRPSRAVPWPPAVIAAGGKRLPTCCPGAAGMAGKVRRGPCCGGSTARKAPMFETFTPRSGSRGNR